MGYRKYTRKKDSELWDAVSWIREHPEDIPMARENLNARERGYDDDAVRQLMAAICLAACEDYKLASSKYVKDTKIGKATRKECEEFFGGDIFQYFVKGRSVRDIKRLIKTTDKKFKVRDSQKIQGLL